MLTACFSIVALAEIHARNAIAFLASSAVVGVGMVVPVGVGAWGPYPSGPCERGAGAGGSWGAFTAGWSSAAPLPVCYAP